MVATVIKQNEVRPKKSSNNFLGRISKSTT